MMYSADSKNIRNNNDLKNALKSELEQYTNFEYSTCNSVDVATNKVVPKLDGGISTKL